MKYDHLVGLPFVHGSDTDCYGIVRQFYRDNFALQLENFARADDWWLHKGMNLYLDNYESQGFILTHVQPHQARPADIFLVTVKSIVANHAGVYLGNGKILHAYTGRLSEVSAMKGIWRNNVCAIIRHPSVIIPPEEKQTIDIMSLLSPHKRAILEHVRSAA